MSGVLVPVSKAFGSYKTIEHRERDRRSANKRRVGGIGQAALGGGTVMAANSMARLGDSNAGAEARYIREPLRHGHKQIWATFNAKHEPLGVGSLRVKDRLRVTATRARVLPRGTAWNVGAGLAGLGAARWATGSAQMHYQNARLREKRLANQHRAKAVTASKALGPVGRGNPHVSRANEYTLVSRTRTEPIDSRLQVVRRGDRSGGLKPVGMRQTQGRRSRPAESKMPAGNSRGQRIR